MQHTNDAPATKADEKYATLDQEVTKTLGESVYGESQAAALNAAAYTLSSAASSHTDAGNHAAAAQAYEKCATLLQEAAGIYGVSGDSEKQADALWYAATALYSAAFSHTNADNHASASQAHENSAALDQQAARIYSAEDSKKQARALQNAARALRNASISHLRTGNYAAADEATRESARLRTEYERILVSLTTPGA
jgi:hypothetical protein